MTTGFSHSNSDVSLQTRPTPECALTLRSAPTGETAAIVENTPPWNHPPTRSMKPQLTYVSLFSGIEACSVAMSRIAEIDWKPVFFSEIEDFPCRVLKYHFPHVPNLGDVTKIRVETRTNPETNTEEKVITNGHTSIPFPRAGIDILAGGSPCQGFSVAGKRLGLDDPRSCLAMHYARLVEELHPRILFYENVPGMLSSAAAGGPGLDFYAFIRTLVNLGYDDISYRVFDAQYVTVDGFPRAVPQRRKRVFLVGLRSVGRAGADVPASAEILFERASLLGDTPPRREAGQGFAAPPGYRLDGDDRVVEDAAGARQSGAGAAEGLLASQDPRGDAGGRPGRVQRPEGEGARASGTVGGGGRDDVSEVLTARGWKGIGARNGEISWPFAAVGIHELSGGGGRESDPVRGDEPPMGVA